MRITALEPESRSGGVRVELDERPFGTIGANDVADLGLGEGRAISDDVSAELMRRAEAFSARTVAMRMLAARSLSSAEVHRRLLRKGHSRPACDSAVQGLVSAGLINDREFARHFARIRTRRRIGPRRVMADLRRMGVPERDATAAINEALESEGVDPQAALREAAEHRARSLKGLDTDTARRRLRAYLLRRGFGGSEVLSVVKDAVPR